MPLLRARRGRSKRQVQGQCWRVGRRVCNRVFLCLQRSCVCCFSVVQRKMLVFPYAVRRRACVVWPAGAWVALCKATEPVLCLPARPPDLFALYLLKLWAGGAWEGDTPKFIKDFFNRVRVIFPAQSGPGSRGRSPLPGRLEWAQPPSKAAVTSPATNWELPVSACLWENRPPRSQSTPWTFT